MPTAPSRTFRSPARVDAPEITRVIQRANVRVSGVPDFDESDLIADWGMAGFDLARNAFVHERDGAIVAYGYWRARSRHADYDADYSVDAERAGDLEPAVLDELERRIRADLTDAPAGARALMHVHADSSETDRLALYRRAGFDPCRYFFSMGIDMQAPPGRPTPPPAGIEIRPCRRGIDEAVAYGVLSDAFRGHYRFVPLERDDWIRRHAGYGFYVPDLWQIAWHGDEAVGASCNLLYEDVGYVDELGVREDWRGRKLGRALLDASFAAFWKHGQPRVRLGVDAENATGATQLYERAGMMVLRKYVLCRKALDAVATGAVPA